MRGEGNLCIRSIPKMAHIFVAMAKKTAGDVVNAFLWRYEHNLPLCRTSRFYFWQIKRFFELQEKKKKKNAGPFTNYSVSRLTKFYFLLWNNQTIINEIGPSTYGRMHTQREPRFERKTPAARTHRSNKNENKKERTLMRVCCFQAKSCCWALQIHIATEDAAAAYTCFFLFVLGSRVCARARQDGDVVENQRNQKLVEEMKYWIYVLDECAFALAVSVSLSARVHRHIQRESQYISVVVGQRYLSLVVSFHFSFSDKCFRSLSFYSL